MPMSKVNAARLAWSARQRPVLMTGDQSRTLRVGDRVCWGATTTTLGRFAERLGVKSPLFGMTEKQVQSHTMTWRRLNG
jgi:hypothetical protein